MHGYGIAQRLQQVSVGLLHVGETTLYSALQRATAERVGGPGKLIHGPIRLTSRILKVSEPRSGCSGEASMNRDELDGKADQIKGKVKKAAGDLTDNDRLHDEGVADEAAGEVQEGFGRARRKVGDAIEDLGDKIKR